MNFETRVYNYILNNYEVPETTHFYLDGDEIDLRDFVEAYVSDVNDNVFYPYGDDSDDKDVSEIGEEILNALTSTGRMTFYPSGLTIAFREEE